MKKVFELGNRYAKQSDWKDFALTKFCLCSMGVILGLHVPKKHKKVVGGMALSVFALTYIPLMAKVFKIMKEMIKE